MPRKKSVCHFCNKEYLRHPGNRGRIHNFCSVECYDSFRVNLVYLTCQECGKTEQLPSYRADRYKYCSSECMYSARARINTKPRVIKKCEQCGNEFEVTDNKAGHKRKFCSHECYGNFRSSYYRGERNHSYVGGTTPLVHKRTRQRSWKRKANRIRERDNNTCQQCGDIWDDSRPLFPVDHIIPWRISRNDSPKNLQVLCNSCHASKTAIERKEYE